MLMMLTPTVDAPAPFPPLIAAAAATLSRGARYGLSGLELDVIGALVRHTSNRNIARQLSMSEGAVKRQLTGIFRKLGVKTRLQLGVFALKHGLTPLPRPVAVTCRTCPAMARLGFDWSGGARLR